MNRIVISASVVAATATAFVAATPAQAQRQISVDATVRAEHQSNAAHASAAFAAATGLQRSDDILSPGVGVNIALPFGQHNFTLAGSANYTFHRRNKKRDRENLNFTAGLAMNLPVCDPNVSASLSRKISDLGDIILSPSANPVTVQNVETVKAVGGTLACGKDFGLRPTVGINYEEGRNDETIRKIRDRNVVNYTAGVAYVHPSIGNLLVSYQLRELRFPNQILPDGRENGNRQSSIGATFSRDIGARLRGSVGVGYSHLKPRQAGVRSFKGMNWSADLSAQATSRMMVRAALSRATSSSLAVDANYQVNTNYGLSASYAVSPLINIDAGFTATKRTYEGVPVPAVPGTQILSGDRRHTFSGSVGYQFRPKLRFSLDAAHERRNGAGSAFDYTNNRIGLTASLAL